MEGSEPGRRPGSRSRRCGGGRSRRRAVDVLVVRRVRVVLGRDGDDLPGHRGDRLLEAGWLCGVHGRPGADKLALARSLGAEFGVDASSGDAVAAVRDAVGGAHASLVTAVAPVAFEQAVAMLRPGGTAVYIGLPGGASDEIRSSIAMVVNGELTVRGSNVGTRADLQEAVDFAVRGHVVATVASAPLSRINDIFDDLRAGRVVGRIVVTPD
jgi:D-arabinose 1-dehydrogenase-like Zn-dependent alcohol dehydrogenase